MKLLLLVLFVFVIFITQVHANREPPNIPNTCQELFKTEQCNKCQSSIWDHVNNPDQCGTLFKFAQEMSKVITDADLTTKSHDIKFLKTSLENYCQKDFQCDQQKAKKIYNEIQNTCEQELSVKLDWSENPNIYDKNSYAAYMTYIAYYDGIPEHQALCAKNNLGDFHSYEFIVRFRKWMMEKTQGDPDAIVSYDVQHVFKGDGEKISVPRSFFCDPNWRKMARIYVDYITEQGINEPIEKNIWGSEQNLENLYLPDCTYHKRGLGEIVKKRTKLNKRVIGPVIAAATSFAIELAGAAVEIGLHVANNN